MEAEVTPVTLRMASGTAQPTLYLIDNEDLHFLSLQKALPVGVNEETSGQGFTGSIVFPY